MVVSQVDVHRLRRCVELARIALEQGHAPFGAMLVGSDGRILYEDFNRTTDNDLTLHAELGVTRWAVANLAPVQRIRATVYTSCEQCPMCAAAHAWAGLGRIVYATSCAQLTGWLAEWDAPAPPVAMLPIGTVVPRVVADGPAPELEDEMRTLYEARYRR
ncbi:nucleoside deaminase [Mycobacterium cookii]|uniref:tRNA-specific adenosine deaminase n=1 Tax=Mycobacterium cookii TaxID=1775 RepID=A0A7I7KT16_9MYCO|nr:nucleoside deaminase [Mycobacterium cookii]MCV7331122.1 nucleoside deaminase [Mycobacterium cookii]BBX44924.1 tRNA-specific adenosine deaminase [Mycobacterium cookii]